MRAWLGFCLVLGMAFALLFRFDPQPFYFAPAPPLETSTQALKEQDTLPNPPVKSVHSATLTALSANYLLGAYFGGSAEGLGDVKIYANLYTLKSQTWSPAFVLLSAPILSQKAQEYVKMLGNPVLYVIHRVLYLFVVGASLGGWATSKIYMLSYPLDLLLKKLEKHQKIDLHFIKVLPLSPFLNISHLVRTAPLPTTDGGFILPIYHELARKFPLLLKFDAHARLQHIIKPNHLKQQLQPSLVPYGHCALMAFRSYKSHNFYTQTCQNPLKWDAPILSNLKNYDDSLNLFNANGAIYLIYNKPLKDSHNSRSALVLAKFTPTPNKPSDFRALATLDQTSNTGEVSYPATLIVKGKVHVLYTKDRHAIKHLSFNLAYLQAL